MLKVVVVHADLRSKKTISRPRPADGHQSRVWYLAKDGQGETELNKNLLMV